MTVQVHGVYSIPDPWKAKMDDPNEGNYNYEVRVSNKHFKGAKIVAREMTDEEKNEAEAAKGKKPVDPKKKGKEEEPTAEELAKWEEEKREREESNNKAKTDWDALDSNTKFFRTCEDPFRSSSIKFMQDETVEDAPDPALQKSDFDETGLRTFESSVCDQRGIWVYFDKIVPQEEETAANVDPKAKKAPAKSKAPTSDEVQKPTHGRAWLNLTQLMEPGASCVNQRVFL